MKKLLLLLVFFLMASFAHAGLVLSVNGLPAPDEIWLYPSDEIVLDIMVPDGHNITGGTFEIVLSNAQAELYSGDITFPDNDKWFFPFYVLSSDSMHVEVTGGGPTPVAGPLTVVDTVILHCLEATDVIVDLHATGIVMVDGVSYEASTIFDSIIVHQVPEPMTGILLGLGGLFLLRRRK